MTEPSPEAIELALREGLARADRAAAAARPVLRHLVAGEATTMLSDETVARVRGLLSDVARQLLTAQADVAAVADAPGYVAARLAQLTARLAADGEWLAHVHALALEGELLERLRVTRGLDPVLTPRIEALAASREADAAALAVAVLAAQVRFVQHHRRMELALRDVPGELYHAALGLLLEGGDDDRAAAEAEQQLRAAYDEGTSRLALLARIALLGGGEGTLEIGHAGLSLFASALAVATGCGRGTALMVLAGGELDQTAIMLRAAGLSAGAIEAQSAWLGDQAPLPFDAGELARGRTAASLDETAI